MAHKLLRVLRAVCLFSLVPAATVRADDLRYDFKPGSRIFYEINVEGDATNVHRKITGYLVLQPKAADAATGEFSVDYSYTPWRVTGEAFHGYDKPDMIMTTAIAKLFESPVPDAQCQHIVLSRNGALSTPGHSDLLAFLQGPAIALVLQPLPPPGQSAWTTHRSVDVYRGFSPDGSGAPFRQSLFDPEWKASPADETITYTAGQPTGSSVTIQRSYELLSQQKVGDNPVARLHGDGRYVFDNQAGSVTSVDWNLTDEMATNAGVVSIPVIVNARRLDGDDLTKVRVEIDAVDGPLVKDEEQSAVQDATEKANSNSKPVAASPEISSRLPTGLSATDIMGTTDGAPFVAINRQHLPVIGFRFQVSDFGGRKCFHRFEPLYAKPSGADQKDVTVLLAKDGYAVGSVTINSGEFVNALFVTFMKKTAAGLDPKTQYDSPWYGQQVGTSQHTLGGTGKFVYGICGRKGLNVDAIGLVVAAPTNPK